MQGGPDIRIDQVLHGYDRGHRELAASLALDEPSRATMLIFSDMPAAPGLAEGHSYLAAYPIRGASRHVLARTWAAGRRYRPGSVWTHSLILDYQALARIPDLVPLLQLFKNPNLADPAVYTQALSFSTAKRSCAAVENGPRSAVALAQLYGDAPMQEIVVQQVSDELDELLALALWRQMWPGLRRGFAFSTGLTTRPVGFDCDCSLRFALQSSHVALEVDADLQAGYRALLDDLQKPGPTRLRTFLGRHVIESKEPRSLALRLATWAVDEGDLSLQERLRRLRRLTRDERLPRLMRDVLADAFHHVSTAAELIALARLVRNEVFDVAMARAIECARLMSERDCRRLFTAIQASLPNQVGGRLFDELVRALRPELLAFAANTSNRMAMLHLRPELFSVRTFWPEGDEERAAMVAQADGLGDLDLDKGFATLGTSIGPSTLTELLNRSSDIASGTAAELLASEDGQVRDLLANWIMQVPHRLLSVAASGKETTCEMIEVLAGAQIRSRSRKFDADSWLSLFTLVRNEPKFRFAEAGLAIGYLCATRLDGRNARSLAMAVYDPLLRTVRTHALSPDIERYLQQELKREGRARSLRNTLSQSAIERWPPGDGTAGALAFSTDSANLRDLVDETAVNYGRSVLEGALATADVSVEAQLVIKQYLKKPQNKSRLFWWW